METAGIIATVVTGGIAIIAATVKMMDKNGFFCQCKGCGCDCKIDGRKSETRQMELQNTNKQLEIESKTKRYSIFNSKRGLKEIKTPELVEIELKEDSIQEEPKKTNNS